MARIVFANGSKQMSHNNEDLYERWLARRQMAPAEPVHNLNLYIAQFVPSLSAIVNLDDAEWQRINLNEKREILERELVRLKQLHSNNQIALTTYRAEKNTLSKAVQKVDEQQRVVKQWLKEHRPMNDQESELDTLHAQLRTVRAMRDYWQEKSGLQDAQIEALRNQIKLLEAKSGLFG